MLANMRRLHPRGAVNRGICVDAEGAMLAPDCVLVHHTSRGYRAIGADDALALQKHVLAADRDSDWLYRQCQRIADALNKGEIALAQIYGLHIPIADLDDRRYKRIALAKTGFNPDEPRIPKGEPHAGEWTTGGAGDEAGDESGGDDGSGDAGAPGTFAADSATDPTGTGEQMASSESPPIKWEFGSPGDGSPASSPADAAGNGSSTTSSSNRETTALSPAGIDAINPDYSIENLLLFLLGAGGSGSATRLARALLRLGFSRGLNADTHHVVSRRALMAEPARKALERFGINLDEPANGVFLPEVQHDHLHTNAYYEAVNRELATARTKAEAEQILRSIARRLAEGKFP